VTVSGEDSVALDTRGGLAAPCSASRHRIGRSRAHLGATPLRDQPDRRSAALSDPEGRTFRATWHVISASPCGIGNRIQDREKNRRAVVRRSRRSVRRTETSQARAARPHPAIARGQACLLRSRPGLRARRANRDRRRPRWSRPRALDNGKARPLLLPRRPQRHPGPGWRAAASRREKARPLLRGFPSRLCLVDVAPAADAS
jgi:hypothetical protein